MHVSTILSRQTRAKSKSLTKEELKEHAESARKMAIKWMVIPDGSQQANKYWDAVSYYEKMIEKKEAKEIII